MLLIGDVTKKKRLLDMLSPAGLPAALPGGLGTLVRQVFEAMHPVLAGLLCVWVVLAVVQQLRGSARERQTRRQGDKETRSNGGEGFRVQGSGFSQQQTRSNGGSMCAGSAAGGGCATSSAGVAPGAALPHGPATAQDHGTRRRRPEVAEDAVRPGGGTGGWMLLVLVCWGMMMLALRRTAGYMSHRHVMFLGIVLLPLAGQALVVLVDAGRRGLGRWRSFVPPAGVAAVLIGAGLAGHALRDPLYQGTGVYYQVAEYLAGQAASDDTVLAEGRAMEFALREARSDWHVLRLDGPDLLQRRPEAGLAAQASTRPGEALVAANEMLPVMDRSHAGWVAILLPGGPAGRAWLGQSGLIDLYEQPIPTAHDELHVLRRPWRLGAVPATRPAETQPGVPRP